MTDVSKTLNAWASNYESTIAVQGESNGRTINVTVIDRKGQTDNSFTSESVDRPVDLTDASVRLYIHKPDNTTVFTDGTVTNATNGICSFILPYQATTVSGSATCEVLITWADNRTLKAVGLTLNVLSSNLEGAVESSDEFSALVVALNEIAQSVVDAQTAVTNANAAIDGANTARDNANSAAAAANTAADTANASASNADAKAALADTATTNANTATTNTNAAISAAETATANANTAADRANTAAQNAEDAIAGQLDPSIDARIAAKTDVAGGIAGYDSANAHYTNSALHVTSLTCTKSSTVYALTGLSASSGLISCVFKADADYAEGDTFTIDGMAVTAQLQNGESLPDEFFKAGATVPFIYDAENAKLNFKQSGGAKLNLFVQPDEPENKNGMWIQAPEKHTVNRIESKNSFTIGGEIRTYDSSLHVTHYATQDNQRIVIVSYNNDIYQISGYVSATDLTLAINKWDHSTNTMSTVYSHAFSLSGSASSVSAVIACVSGTTLYAATSCCYSDTNGTIFCNFDLTTQTGTTTENADDRLTNSSGVDLHWFPSGQIGYKDTTAYYLARLYDSYGTGSYATRLFSFDFSISARTHMETIVSGSTESAGWKQYSEGVLVDDKIYYQCFTDSSDTSQTTIRVFDTTTNTETTQSLGGSLHPLPSIYGITAYQNKLYLQFQTYNTTLHEYEIGVWTVRPIASFAITIVAIIQIGTSLAVLDSSGHIQYYDFESETLSENSLAVLDGTSRKVQLISTSKQNLPLYFQDAWWYGTNFNEYPTYTGDGTAWTKYKN